MFEVNLERIINSGNTVIISNVTIQVRADNRDEAAAVAESQLHGWRTANVVKV